MATEKAQERVIARPAATHRAMTLRPWFLRSLSLKLTVAFLCVGLAGALLVALFVGQRTRRAFDQFVTDRGRATLVTELARYYEDNNGWDGVASVVQRGRAGQQGPPEPHEGVIVCNEDGRVVAGGGRYQPGTRIPLSQRSHGEPITVDGTVVGWLLGGPGTRRPGPGTPEADLLANINQAVTFSAVGAVGLALVLGGLLARTLTHPLRELTAATQAVAQGGLGHQVVVRSGDELGALAVSFNQMSTDLAQASSLRRQMTADIAHDLRTPLSVILGYSEALRDGKLPGTQDIFDTIYTEAQHLQHLVEDLRTLSLADAGELPLTRQRIDPRALLERAAMAHMAQARSQGIILIIDVGVQVTEIDVDPERVSQVLGNLLNNALRYTPPKGTITLGSRVQAGEVRLTVQDTGEGIAPENVPHVFERFYRADPSRQQDRSSGLGLAIAKSIVEAHGGRISVTSRLEEGTTFSIDLPVAALAPREQRDH